MEISFDSKTAGKYGIGCAILIRNFQFWIATNSANGQNRRENRTWSYMTMDGFTKLFPFWSSDQIRRLLIKLTEQEIIIKDEFNKNSFDRTSWYAFKNEEIWIKEYIDFKTAKSSRRNRQVRDGEIANSYIYNNNKDKIKDTEQDIEFKNLKEFILHRKDMKAPMSSLAIAKLKTRLRKLKDAGYDPDVCIDNAIMNGWKSVHGIDDVTTNNNNEPKKYVGKSGFINPDWSMWEARKNQHDRSSDTSSSDKIDNSIQQATDRRAIEHMAGSTESERDTGNPFNIPSNNTRESSKKSGENTDST